MKKKFNKNKVNRVVILGAGAFGREVLWTIQDCNKDSVKYDIVGFLDDDKSLKGKLIHNVPILGGIDWFRSKNIDDVGCIIAINDNKVRQKMVEKLEKMDVKFPTIIHPSVIYSDFVDIGKGTIIQAGSIMTSDIKIGNHIHINLNCTVGHDCILEDFVTLNPGVHINGNNILEQGTYIGSGVTTINKIKIGKWSVIGAGTVLIDDAKEFSLYVGVPGKFKKKLPKI